MTHRSDPLPLRTARLTGMAYLALALSAAPSYFVIRPRLVVTGDAPATMMRLIENESLARLGLVVDLALVTASAVTALLFFALFRRVNTPLAVALTTFGCMSSVLGAVGVVFSARALDLAANDTGTNEGVPDLVLLLTELHQTMWSVNALFFGLWLIPMGLLALRSGWMPRPLGWVLFVGGFGYVASCVVDQVRPEAAALVEFLTMPASIGEFWMMAYLLVRGSFRPSIDPSTDSLSHQEQIGAASTAVRL